jgi:hypothetical protein
MENIRLQTKLSDVRYSSCTRLAMLCTVEEQAGRELHRKPGNVFFNGAQIN